MSLQMIIGGEGSYRSEQLYRKLIGESIAHPEQQFFLIVPEQYTMQTQMKMTELHPGHGVMNVDVVSFPRLAYRIFDEIGGIQKSILEDTGKSMVIRRLLSERKEEFEAFAGSIGKTGFVKQAKSMLSELFQYSVQSSDLEKSREIIGGQTMLGRKLKDIQVLYDAFKDYMADTYMTAEELLDVLADQCRVVHQLGACQVLLALKGVKACAALIHTPPTSRSLQQCCPGRNWCPWQYGQADPSPRQTAQTAGWSRR